MKTSEETGPNSGLNSAAEFDRMKPEQKEALLGWIKDTLTTARRRHPMTSYGLKHVFEKDGFYITNGQFKGAMLAAGHAPVDPDALNWSFRVKAIAKPLEPAP